MIGTKNIATLAVLATSAVPFVSAQVPGAVPITIGQLGIPHGHLIVAWTPTKTTMQDACNGTRTLIQSVHTNFPSNPLCDFPFEVDGVKNMKLVCDPAQTTKEVPVAITTNGQVSHNCTYLPINIFWTSCGGGAALAQQYACQ